MAPDNLNERVAALEPQVSNHEKDIMEFRSFKDDMIQELATLKGSLNLLAFKVSIFTGLILLAGSQLVPWLFKKILP